MIPVAGGITIPKPDAVVNTVFIFFSHNVLRSKAAVKSPSQIAPLF
jgi:hypothetical protein